MEKSKPLICFNQNSKMICADIVVDSLAYAEVYHMAALMALRVLPRARLQETTMEDITYDHDLIVVQTKKGSISVRIKVD